MLPLDVLHHLHLGEKKGRKKARKKVEGSIGTLVQSTYMETKRADNSKQR
jgi:hypothetical protein